MGPRKIDTMNRTMRTVAFQTTGAEGEDPNAEKRRRPDLASSRIRERLDEHVRDDVDHSHENGEEYLAEHDITPLGSGQVS
jgi:hypothetical protein